MQETYLMLASRPKHHHMEASNSTKSSAPLYPPSLKRDIRHVVVVVVVVGLERISIDVET